MNSNREIKSLVDGLRQTREDFYELCNKKIVGIDEVHTYADKIIDCFSHHLTKIDLKGVCVFASGGLGRKEVSFASDLDLVFLYPRKLPKDSKLFIESLISSLWDSGFEVGQQVCSPLKLISLAKKDFSICTSILETHFLGGNIQLYTNFKNKFLSSLSGGRKRQNFLKNLKQYREERIKKYGESIYLIEPTIKEGLGGLRDIHCIKWGSIVCLNTSDFKKIKALGWINEDELRWLMQGHDFLWKVRILLHRISDTKKERLTLQDQYTIARLMGFSQGEFVSPEESFMRMYYRYSSRIKRVTNFLIEKLFDKIIKKKKRVDKIISGPFIVTNNLIKFKDPEDVNIRPEILMELFFYAAKLKLNFHHDTGRIIRENLYLVEDLRSNEKVISMFFDILLNEEKSFEILKAMHETKFLDTFIPEFEHVRYRVQYDTYHTYTVDEHLLRTIKELHEIKRGDYSHLFQENINIKILFLAGLLHDIGKGYGKNHSKTGAELAKNIGKRMLLSEEEIELLYFLIENHLLLAETALKRDLEDEKLIERCMLKIGSLKRLYMLFLIQIADSMATGERAWNPWRKTLLEELFIKIKNMFKQEKINGESIVEKIERIKQKVVSIVPHEERESITKWMEELSVRYLMSINPEDIYLHYTLEKKFRSENGVVLNLRALESGIWEFIFVCKDHPRLFDFITGVLWANGVNILAADIFTRSYATVLDIIKVVNIPDPFNIEKFCVRIKDQLDKLIKGEYNLDSLYEQRYYTSFNKYNYLKRNDKVIINEEASDFYTVIEVYTWERPGVLHTISKVLHEFDLDIKLAKITTPGEQVVDVFYVTTREGTKILDNDVQKKIEKSLLNALKELG